MLSAEAWIAVAAIVYNTYLTQRNGKKADEVHTLVNDRATKQDNRIDQLTDALRDSDTDIPDRPNGHPAGGG